MHQETLKLFDEVYKNTYKDISKYVILHTKNLSDVSDIIQNIYVNLLKKLPSNYIKDYKLYLFGIAKKEINIIVLSIKKKLFLFLLKMRLVN